MSDTITTTAPTDTASPADGTAANLSVAHIQNAVRVIDYACEAGAFKGWTVLTQVKELRDALDAFVKLVAPDADAVPTETVGDGSVGTVDVSPAPVDTTVAA